MRPKWEHGWKCDDAAVPDLVRDLWEAGVQGVAVVRLNGGRAEVRAGAQLPREELLGLRARVDELLAGRRAAGAVSDV